MNNITFDIEDIQLVKEPFLAVTGVVVRGYDNNTGQEVCKANCLAEPWSSKLYLTKCVIKDPLLEDSVLPKLHTYINNINLGKLS